MTETIADLSTPALIVDVRALDANIARMADFFAAGPCRLRPHFKAHKTPAIAQRQLAAGGCVGITCATVGEAEIAAGFCHDILLANEIADASKARRLAALAGRVTLTVAADSREGVELLSAAATAAGVTIGVLVDVNVGQQRCGVTPGPAALALAQAVTAAAGLSLRGVMGYEGHVQPVRDRDERAAAARTAMASLVATADLLRASGLACDIVSAGGSGTYDVSGRLPGITEIQAGSYALMDSDYGAVGLPFAQAFWVLGTVVSRPSPDRCVADCGHKSATKDHGVPVVHGIEGGSIVAFNDEHAVIAIPPTSSVRIGDRVRLVPSHTDPTVNLHDAFYVVEGERVVDVWPIAGRGYPEHRHGTSSTTG